MPSPMTNADCVRDLMSVTLPKNTSAIITVSITSHFVRKNLSRSLAPKARAVLFTNASFGVFAARVDCMD